MEIHRYYEKKNFRWKTPTLRFIISAIIWRITNIMEDDFLCSLPLADSVFFILSAFKNISQKSVLNTPVFSITKTKLVCSCWLLYSYLYAFLWWNSPDFPFHSIIFFGMFDKIPGAKIYDLWTGNLEQLPLDNLRSRKFATNFLLVVIFKLYFAYYP